MDLKWIEFAVVMVVVLLALVFAHTSVTTHKNEQRQYQVHGPPGANSTAAQLQPADRGSV